MVKRGRPPTKPLTRTESLLSALLVAIWRMHSRRSDSDLSVELERLGLSREQAADLLGTTPSSLSATINRQKRAQKKPDPPAEVQP